MGKQLNKKDAELIAIHIVDGYKKQPLLFMGTICFTIYIGVYLIK